MESYEKSGFVRTREHRCPAERRHDSAFDAHAGSGGDLGRKRSIRRRISANKARDTATSASWNTT